MSVLKLIAAGNANKQIADQLSITEETVKWRVKNILSKLGAHDRTHAAIVHGLKTRHHRSIDPHQQSLSRTTPKRVDTTLSLEFPPNSEFPGITALQRENCLLRPSCSPHSPKAGLVSAFFCCTSYLGLLLIWRALGRLSSDPSTLVTVLSVLGIGAGLLLLMGLWTPMAATHSCRH